MNDNKLMNRAADNIRILAASMVEKANSGHPGGAMGGADFVNVLFSEFLVYDPENPAWEGRDRFFLDPGTHVTDALLHIGPDRQVHAGRTETSSVNGEALLRDIPNVTSCAASKTLPDRSARDTHLQSVRPSQPSS